MAHPVPSNRGFTLLEMLVAMAVLATGLLLLLQAVSDSNRAISTSQALTRAVLLAQSQLAEGASATPLKQGMQYGTSEQMQWRLHTMPYEQPHVLSLDRDIEPWRLRVAVDVQVGGATRQVVVETVVLAQN